MSRGYTGVTAHDSTVNAAELVLQSAVAAANNNAVTIRNAEVTYYRAVVKSALANGVSPAASMQALKELGVSGQ
jgi:hypothetical protein